MIQPLLFVFLFFSNFGIFLDLSQGWVCPKNEFNTSIECNCNCGIWDPDCADSSLPLIGCGASGEKCSSEGKCIFSTSPPPEWTCDVDWYGKDGWCDCSCGAYDPDCDDISKSLYGCPSTATRCDFNGECVEDELYGWTCNITKYNDGNCDCGCGKHDPGCDNVNNPVNGCNDSAFSCSNGNCVSSDWTCDIAYFGDNEFCDCECGSVDPDCGTSYTYGENGIFKQIRGCLNEDGIPIGCNNGLCVYDMTDYGNPGGAFDISNLVGVGLGVLFLGGVGAIGIFFCIVGSLFCGCLICIFGCFSGIIFLGVYILICSPLEYHSYNRKSENSNIDIENGVGDKKVVKEKTSISEKGHEGSENLEEEDCDGKNISSEKEGEAVVVESNLNNTCNIVSNSIEVEVIKMINNEGIKKVEYDGVDFIL